MKKKILYVHHAGGLGGAPKSLSILLNGLDKSKYDPFVFMLMDGPAKNLFIKEEVKLIVSEKSLFAFHGTMVSGMSFRLFIKNILYALPNAITAYGLIKKLKPNIIHLNTSCLFIYALIAKFFFKKVKVVSHIREPLLNNLHGKVLEYFNKKYVDFFIPINDFESTFFKGKSLEIIKNSVDKNIYKFNFNVRKEERERKNLSDDLFIIGFFARFNIENGIEDLLKIAQEIKIIDSQIKILVYGYEPTTLNDEIKDIAKEMPENVILEGMVNDVHNKMQIIDILISPFKTAHFSRSVIEAQALSIPVLVSNVDSQNTLLENQNTGYIYNFGNIKEAVEKVLFLKNNLDVYNLMKVNARSYAETNFCHEKNNKKVYSIYEKLLKSDTNV